jgi:hypothetical protein
MSIGPLSEESMKYVKMLPVTPFTGQIFKLSPIKEREERIGDLEDVKFFFHQFSKSPKSKSKIEQLICILELYKSQQTYTKVE